MRFLIAVMVAFVPWSNGAQAPLDALADEVTELKTIVTSIQGSLMTSVRLLQGATGTRTRRGAEFLKPFLFSSPDQLDQLGKQHLTQIDSRLGQMESRLATVEAEVLKVGERAHVWDTFQHHLTAWSDLMTSIDSKVDYLGR